nr:hypothetical protein [Bdellovibrionales bacterium]
MFALVLTALTAVAHADTKLCDNVILREGKLSLSRNEEVLVCGSSKGKEGWRDVPLPQAEYQLKVLFQAEGFYEPRFERQGTRLFVWSGPRREIKSFATPGGVGRVVAKRKRKVVGESLTPDKMNEIENWADTGLRSRGYGCPQVDLEAQAWDGTVVARMTPGEVQRVAKIQRSGFEGLD